MVLSNCYYEKLEFKYRLENNMNLYEQLRERLIKKNVESALYLTMLKYFSNISLNQYTELKTNETLLEAIMKDENERRKKRNIKPLMQKAAGNTLEQSISNLKGKDKEMYMQKLEKKMKYEEKIQNIINKNEEKP